MRKPTILFTCIALLVVAAGLATLMMVTGPKAERKAPPKTAALVDVQTLVRSNETVVLELTGTVVPAREVILRSRVPGEVVSISENFIDGGFLKKDEEVLKIDPVDYELALATARSALETARFNHKLELGRQDVARREWELLKTDDATEQERELALRIPHLAASKAALQAAQATVEEAELNLERTSVKAPYNAVVLTRNVQFGSQAAIQDPLAKLAGTDAYWILVSIPIDRLEWVDIPGSQVKVSSASGAEREGRVIRLLADLEEMGRMARLLIEVDDPLCLKPEHDGKQSLLIGEYVRTAISGRALEQVYRIPREALHDNRTIWIATADGTLDIRAVDVLWKNGEQALVRERITDGEKLIVSDLTTPIQGMPVAIANSED